MSVSRRQAMAIVLLIALPLCVSALTGVGLWRQDRMLQRVAEEYGEVRLLQSIDSDLGLAVFALEGDDPGLQAASRKHLEAAEGALVRYLATQYDSIATAEHQAGEAVKASTMLVELQQLLAAPAAEVSSPAQHDKLLRLRRTLDALHREVDSGVRLANESARQIRRSTLVWVVAASLASTLICGALLAWSVHGVNRRLHDLRHRLAAFVPGGPPRAPKGMGQVVDQIEDLNFRMVQKVEESGRELLRRERLAGIGLLAADVAHEINNPMNAMLGLSELGLRSIERGPIDEPTRVELRESLAVVRREALRCKSIVERLVALARTDRKPTWFDATQLVQETVHVARAARPERAPCIVVTGGNPNVCAFGLVNDVRQILLTLLVNAADAIDPDGRIEVDATKTEKEVWLRVRDNGRGFTENMRRTFFTPFQSYTGEGTGLGLAIAQALAEGMGASLRPFSEGPGRGSMFVLAIPIPEERP